MHNQIQQGVNGRSRRHENLIRYVAFSRIAQFGLKKTLDWLQDIVRPKKTQVAKGLDEAQIRRNCNGIETELKFFCAKREPLLLIPTLDAGCQFDFVGMDKGQIKCYDVTKTVGAKLDSKIPVNYGECKWPFIVAQVANDRIEYYQSMSNGLSDTPIDSEKLNVGNSVAKIDGLKISRHDLEFFMLRHDMFSRLFTRKARSKTLASEIDQYIIADKGRRLLAHLYFYETYRYALNLVPTLSYGDMIDFVGQHNAKLERYHLIVKGEKITCGDRYFNETYGYDDSARIVMCDIDQREFVFEHCDSPLFAWGESSLASMIAK